MLQNLTYGENDMELNVRHILKKCEAVMKMARHQAGRAENRPPPLLPRQHSSPATTVFTAHEAMPRHSNSAPTTPNPLDHLHPPGYCLSPVDLFTPPPLPQQ